MVIVDTCIWSTALRRGTPRPSMETRELERLIIDGQVRMLGPIRQEILSGVRDKRHFDRLKTHLSAFPDAPLECDDYVLAASFFNLCRSNGVQGSNTDFLVCAHAARMGEAIYTTDRDFTHFARYLPIVLHVPPPFG